MSKREPYLGNPQATIAVLNKYGFTFQKKFGQNFLIDPHVLDKIIRAAEITEDDFVLEIGPGMGTMTQYLAYAAREVYAVEIDKSLIPILEDTLSDYDNVTVINEDILKVNIAKLAKEKNGGRPIKVVANLPYYITTPIIMGLFANVPPNCFMPRPKVGSAVIRLTRHAETPVQVDDEKLLFQIIRASFNQRRKTLANGLKNYEGLSFEKETIEAAIAECGFSPSVRGEALSLEEFAKLANVLGRAK